MSNDDKTITLLANRAADLLCAWADLPSTRKNDNGDRSYRGGLSMMLGVLADKGVPLPSDAHRRLSAELVALCKKHVADRGYVYLSMDVDYGPSVHLQKLAAAAGLERITWPIKSHMTITTVCSDGSGSDAVIDSQGYGAPQTTYKLASGGAGWLITKGFYVDSKIEDVCIAAARGGHPALKWEEIAALE
jgi:hypothetical protein